MLALRVVFRSLVRTPWYAGTVIGVIALGMTLLTTVFAVVDGTLFNPLGYPDSARLFAIRPALAGRAPSLNSWIASDVTWTAAVPEAMLTAYNARQWVGVGEDVNEGAIGIAEVQANFFDVIGVRPLIGGFAPDDFEDSALLWPVVISYDAWQVRFQGDPHVIGRTIVFDPTRGAGYRVVGVMPAGFVFPSDRVTASLITPAVRRGNRVTRQFTDLVARVPPGMTAADLRARVEAAMAAPPSSPGPPADPNSPELTRDPIAHVDVVPLSRALGTQARALFSAVFLAALVLVAVGALNASGLMAARALDRAPELAVRRALGASAAAIARLVLSESLVLIGAGIILGVALARPVLRLGLHLLPSEIVLLKPAAIDWRVAAFGALAAVVLGIATAVWPIRQALRGGSGTAPGSRATERSRSIGRLLVIATQVAGAFVLAVAGALLVGSILTVYASGLPIRTDGVVTITTHVVATGAAGGMAESPERTSRVASVIDRLRTVPGVTAVAVTAAELLDGGNWPSPFLTPEGGRRLAPDVQAVTPDYYRIVQPQLIAGRLPTDQELAHDDRVIVVSDMLARAYWPSQSPLGMPLVKGAFRDNPALTFTVIGVVKDVRWWSWDTKVASIYGPYALLTRSPFPTFLLQTQGQSARVTADALQAMAQADPLLRPTRTSMLEDLFVDSVRPRRFQSWLFGSFATAALVVVGVGMLGLLAMATARRTREIGIRMALGAASGRVVRWLVVEQLTAVTIGLAGGALISAWTVRFLKQYLYDITIFDARVWGAATALIVVTTALGALIPAVRASRTDPVRALRVE